MPTIFTLAAPSNVGTIGSPVTVAALAITGVSYTSTPKMAPIGTGQLVITLTETTNGWQETIRYADATVISFLAQVVNSAPFSDAVAQAVFTKLITDGKLPAGTVTTST
jgi:hypothetical protein